MKDTENMDISKIIQHEDWQTAVAASDSEMAKRIVLEFALDGWQDCARECYNAESFATRFSASDDAEIALGLGEWDRDGFGEASPDEVLNAAKKFFSEWHGGKNRYRITDGNATEEANDLQDAAEIAADWYDWLFDEHEIAPIPANLYASTLDGLNASIARWQDRIAEALGHAAWHGHGTYSASAASQAGLHLVVKEMEKNEP